MRSALRLANVAGLFLLASGASAQSWIYKDANDSWTWMEDYVYFYATYIVACESGRQCQVGTGIHAFGEPRGEKIRFSGQKEILVIGVGAIYLRADDDKGSVKVAFVQKTNKLIPIIDANF